MTDRDRLAADLHERNDHLGPVCDGCNAMADHLIALGWIKVPNPPVMVTDPGAAQMADWLAAWERSEGQGSNTYVPRELSDSTPVHMDDYMAGYRQGKSDAMEDWDKMRRPLDEERLARALRRASPGPTWRNAAAIAKAYREDTE